MQKPIINATVSRTSVDANPMFKIVVPNNVETTELEYVLTRVMYNMVRIYARGKHIPFEDALVQYKEAMAVHIGVIHDQEQKLKEAQDGR
ncbi:hypothetical protein LBW12_02625 [Latilactobacillus curvatus]|uniref:hypothetical protein n=1 Tax=Latilactobacillus curvatus TaxID=28038 RepID=UPI0020C8282B|nr:hypothetical protein [Latilactobacillus curvatus]MCP8858920.1 hypothetical protein [Latilactobacillus curvatus]